MLNFCQKRPSFALKICPRSQRPKRQMKAYEGQQRPGRSKTSKMQTTELDCEKLSIHFDLPFHCNVVHYCNDKKANSLGFKV